MPREGLAGDAPRRARKGCTAKAPATVALAAALLCAVALAPAQAVVDPSVPAARDTEPVILTGADFADWSAASNTTVRLPLLDLAECETFDEQCDHNHYADPELDTQELAPQRGTSVDRILGYRWTGSRWQQVPLQVDEQFTRYLANPASGFSVYSGEDQHTTYAFDREGFRYTRSTPADPCTALPDSEAAGDPVQGLDNNDEVAFMSDDAGPAAPSDAKLPAGIESARQVAVVDPYAIGSGARYVYVMRASANGPRPAFDASNGYVRYQRDANADVFEKSESSYEGYGNAARGPVCDAQGNVVAQNERRRPRDYATVTTGRYRFRYDGRWLMTQINIATPGGDAYGPDIIDRWKARAFAQDPGSETPCCGFEEEDTNWGGSSTLIGERSGPVRTIRETWGADSGTNVIRRETFYREEVRQKSYLRVHVIPPLDGIYAQWDFNAGRVTRFYNEMNADGVPIDGSNDEAFGNIDDPCNDRYDQNDTGDFDQGIRDLYEQLGLCGLPYHQSVDPSDPTFSGVNATLGWTETAGPHGTIVDRYSTRIQDFTPLGVIQGLVAVPYYRDDARFDDGTGTNPGPKLNLRSGNEPTVFNGVPRVAWTPADGPVDNDPHFFQGSIGTHGLHLLFLVDSDNARQTVPLSEIVTEQRMVMLPGNPGNVGERYGRGFEKPLLAFALPFSGGNRSTEEEPPEEPPPPPRDPGPGPGEGSGQGGGAPAPGAPGAPAPGTGQGGPTGGGAPEPDTSFANSRARCQPRELPVRRRGIGAARIGDARAEVAREAGAPRRDDVRLFTYCVARGGRLFVVFDEDGEAILVASTARGHDLGGAGPRDRRAELARRLGSLRRVITGVVTARRAGGVLFVLRRGRITGVAAAARDLLDDPRALRAALRRAGLL